MFQQLVFFEFEKELKKKKNCYTIMLFELKDEHCSSMYQCFHLIKKWCGDFDILVPAAQEQPSQAYGDIQLMPITSGLL